MTTVIDSSAILRLCFREGDLSLAERAMTGTAAVSVLATAEVPCAIHARRHRGELDNREAERLVEFGEALLATTARLALSPTVIREAVDIGSSHLIRTLDAIHLATAMVADRRQRRRGASVRFCTADLRQAEVAIALLGRDRVDLVPPHRPV